MTDVCIAQGHGHRSDGTFDPGTSDGIHNEQRDSKPVARACTARLRSRYGLDVASEHEMDRDPNWPGTRDWANRLRCRVCMSLHFDYKLAPIGAFSIQTSDEGRLLGWAIEDAVETAGFEIRPYPDDRDNLGLLNGTDMPCVIFECGRIGSAPIDEVHEQEAMGRAVADGIAHYLDVDPQEEDMPYSLDEIADAVWGRRIAHLDPTHGGDGKKIPAGEALAKTFRNATQARRNSQQVYDIKALIRLVRDEDLTKRDVKDALTDQGLTPDLIRQAVADAGADVDGDAVVDAIIDRLAD